MQSPTSSGQAHGHVTLNKVINHILRSPVHVSLSGNLMLITYMGRKSGRSYTIPVTYLQQGDDVTVFSNQGWWHNLEGGVEVTLQLRGRAYTAIGTPSRDSATIVQALKAFFMQKGVKRAWMINVSGLDARRAPTEAELKHITEPHVVVRFSHLQPVT